MILQSPYNIALLAILATLLISIILFNNIVLFSTIAIASSWILFENDVDFAARKLCSCFKILREGKQDIRFAEWSPFGDWETIQRMQEGVNKSFSECCNNSNMANLYLNREITRDESFDTENMNGDFDWEAWQNFKPTFRPEFIKIAHAIDKQCPELIRKIDDNWDEVLTNTPKDSIAPH